MRETRSKETSRWNIQIDPAYWVGQLHRSLQGHVATLRNTLRSLEDGSYAERSNVSASAVVVFDLTAQPGPSEIVNQELRKTYLAIIRSFVDFIDTLLGLRKLVSNTLTLTENLEGVEALQAYILADVAKRTQKVGRDGHKSSHEKAAILGNLSPFSAAAVDGYFDIRAAIEHHKAFAQQDMKLCTIGLAVTVNGAVIDQLPYQVKAGQAIGCTITENTRYITKGEQIVLDEEEIEAVVRTISLRLVNELMQGIVAKGPRAAPASPTD